MDRENSPDHSFCFSIWGSLGIKSTPRPFEWIGVPSKNNIACAFAKASGITSIEKWIAIKTTVKIGGTGKEHGTRSPAENPQSGLEPACATGFRL